MSSSQIKLASKELDATYPADAELATFTQNITNCESLMFRMEREMASDSILDRRMGIITADLQSLSDELADQATRALAANKGALDENTHRVARLLPRAAKFIKYCEGRVAALKVEGAALDLQLANLKAKHDADIAGLDAILAWAEAGRGTPPAPPAPPFDNTEQNADDENMNTKIAKLEAISENTTKSLDAIQRRLDDGFKEVRADSAATQRRLDDGLKEVRADASSNFKVLMGIQVTTLLAILGVLARAAKMF